MLLSRFQAVNEMDKSKAVKRLVSEATPDFDFFFMTVMAAAMASFGLIAGSETVVIGSMLLAPIMSPILALALGLSMSSPRLVTRSFNTSIQAIGLVLITSILATLMFSFGHFEITQVALERHLPSLLSFAIAVVAGLAVVFALVQPQLSETLPGIAVAVSLLPPLATVGVGLAHLRIDVAAGAAVMFLINVAGIIFSGMLAFSLMDVHHKKYLADSTIKKEDDRVKNEEEKVKKIAQEIQ